MILPRSRTPREGWRCAGDPRGTAGRHPDRPRASLQGMPPLSPEKPALCAGCGGKIADRYYLLAVDKQWHLRCLKCCECKLALESELTCFAKDGSIYCKEDYYRYSIPIPNAPAHLVEPPGRAPVSPPCPRSFVPYGYGYQSSGLGSPRPASSASPEAREDGREGDSQDYLEHGQ